MTIFLTVLHVLTCLVLIGVVLLQRGKGAEIGAVFGSGASSTVFGARGAGNFLTKLTTGAAIVFMLSSLSLSYLATSSLESTLFDEDAALPEAVAPDASAEAEGGASPFIEIEPAAPEAPAAAPEPPAAAPTPGGPEAGSPEAASDAEGAAAASP